MNRIRSSEEDEQLFEGSDSDSQNYETISI